MRRIHVCSQEAVPQHVRTVHSSMALHLQRHLELRVIIPYTSVHVFCICTCVSVYLRVDPVSGGNLSTHAH